MKTIRALFDTFIISGLLVGGVCKYLIGDEVAGLMLLSIGSGLVFWSWIDLLNLKINKEG